MYPHKLSFFYCLQAMWTSACLHTHQPVQTLFEWSTSCIPEWLILHFPPFFSLLLSPAEHFIPHSIAHLPSCFTVRIYQLWNTCPISAPSLLPSPPFFHPLSSPILSLPFSLSPLLGPWPQCGLHGFLITLFILGKKGKWLFFVCMCALVAACILH